MPVPKLSPICELLHDRLVRLHQVLGIEPQVHFWPLPDDNAYGAKYALACWEFGRNFSFESPVMVGDDPEKIYREMESKLRGELTDRITEHQRKIDICVDGLKFLLKEHD